MEKLEIRQGCVDDIGALLEVSYGMRLEKDSGYFEKSFELQALDERSVLLAYYDGQISGYCMVSWNPKYGFYRKMGVPEVQDLNVLPAYRRRGIGRAMVKYCEGLARDRGREYMGIGVGLDASYGAAQRLYVRMGYVPDGNGVTYDRVNVMKGEMRPIDDEMSLMMVKSL